MRKDGPELILSATDLSNFLGCKHRTALDMAVATSARKNRRSLRNVIDAIGDAEN